VSDVKEAVRVQFVVRATLAAAGRSVGRLEEKLGQIRGEDVIIAGECGEQSAARDAMWEIVTAGLCSEFAHEVAMLAEDDDVSPDVGCTVDGVRWGIECKMLRTADAQQQRNRLIKAATQVQGYGGVERGLVFVNLTDALFHAPWSDPMPKAESIDLFVGAMNEAVLRLDRPDLFARLGNRPKARSFMLFGQTMLHTGTQIEFTTIATWPRGLPTGGPDQGERALLLAFTTLHMRWAAARNPRSRPQAHRNRRDYRRRARARSSRSASSSSGDMACSLANCSPSQSIDSCSSAVGGEGSSDACTPRL
jgi:hypothetical protein